MLRMTFVFAMLWIATSASSADFTFDDIEFWVGDGANEAAFVVDWTDGLEPQSLAWGYRWDGGATGADMLTEIVTADPRLFAKISAPGSFGVALWGVGYDLDDDGFSLSDGTLFDDGIAVTGATLGAVSGDADDHYREYSDFSGFWSYWVSSDGVSWNFADSGMSDRVLVDGAWDGWSWAADFASAPPREPVPAIPEPTTLVLLGGAAALAVRRR